MVATKLFALLSTSAVALGEGEVCGVLDGRKCVGEHLLDAGKTDDESGCCDLCHETEGCKAWTWYKVFGKHCHLYSSCQMRHDWARVGGFVGAGPAAAADLNRRYFGFDPKDADSPLGVMMTTHTRLDIFCGTQCFNGHSDCRMSASLYNSKMMITRDSRHLKPGLDRNTGYVWKADVAEKKIGKCSFMFDGASFQRYNGACGCGGSSGCDNPHSGFNNKCPSTEETCRVTDPEVSHCACDYQGVSNNVDNVQCFFKGPAFDNENVTAANDQLRWMVKERLQRQSLGPKNHDPLSYWNEIVLDEKLMIPLLKQDASNVVEAFFYRKGSREGRRTAMRMKEEFVWTYHSDADIPIIAVDMDSNVERTKEIFFADELLTLGEDLVEDAAPDKTLV